MSLSSKQQIALAILPKISSTLSICGSTFILAECFYFDIKRLKRVYNRLLCAMALLDIMESLWNFASTWPIPTIVSSDSDSSEEESAEASSVAFAVGNDNTCKAQGFFLQLGLAIPILNACLSLYYLLVIRYSWSEEKIRKKAEPWFYAVGILVGFGTALAGIPLNLYHNSGLWCWIADASDDHNSGIDNHHQFYRYTFYFIPLFLCFIAIAVNMGLLTWTVRRLESASKKYRSSSYAKRCTGKSGYTPQLRRGSQRLVSRRSSYISSVSRNGSAADRATTRVTAIHGHPQDDEESGKVPSTSTSTSTPPSGKRDSILKRSTRMMKQSVTRHEANDSSNADADMNRILELKRSTRAQSFSKRPSFHLVPPKNNADMNTSSSQPVMHEGSAISSTRTSNSLSLNDNHQSIDAHSNVHREKDGDNQDTGTGVFEILSATTPNDHHEDEHKQSTYLRATFLRSYRPSVKSSMRSDMSTSILHTKNNTKNNTKKSKSKQVTEQALFYVLSFILTFFWSFLHRLYTLSGKDAPFVTQLGNAFFDPLQGFINYLVYIRPKLISYGKRFPFASRYQRLKAIITHHDILHDEDKEVEDCAKKELVEWRRMSKKLPAV